MGYRDTKCMRLSKQHCTFLALVLMSFVPCIERVLLTSHFKYRGARGMTQCVCSPMLRYCLADYIRSAAHNACRGSAVIFPAWTRGFLIQPVWMCSRGGPVVARKIMPSVVRACDRCMHLIRLWHYCLTITVSHMGGSIFWKITARAIHGRKVLCDKKS